MVITKSDARCFIIQKMKKGGGGENYLNVFHLE
jgi:hypothetical protein